MSRARWKRLPFGYTGDIEREVAPMVPCHTALGRQWSGGELLVSDQWGSCRKHSPPSKSPMVWCAEPVPHGDSVTWTDHGGARRAREQPVVATPPFWTGLHGPRTCRKTCIVAGVPAVSKGRTSLLRVEPRAGVSWGTQRPSVEAHGRGPWACAFGAWRRPLGMWRPPPRAPPLGRRGQSVGTRPVGTDRRLSSTSAAPKTATGTSTAKNMDR